MKEELLKLLIDTQVKKCGNLKEKCCLSAFMWVLKEFTDFGEEIVIGCIGAEVNKEGTEVTIGPIAVRPEYQVLLVTNTM